MKNHLLSAGVIVLSLTAIQCKSGLVTMSNSCYDMINTGQSQNNAGNYSAALDNFSKVLSKCDAYDAKEKAYAGKAAALNGLHQYNDALTAANAGLKINGSSLDNLFERANGELGLGMRDDARADLNTILNLTAKNRNTAQRATIFARIADVETRQQLYSDALQHIGEAIDMDGTNANFYGQRAVTLLSMYEKKYGTSDAATLKKKISASDKQALCTGIQTAQSKGLRDVQVDLVQATICQ
ncbi:MAG TPA: tetratricopeptide repeat protein [Puia sp.]|jgi:tetratricopeptide (TPR) repeat protein